jgi:hypothetical protein
LGGSDVSPGIAARCGYTAVRRGIAVVDPELLIAASKRKAFGDQNIEARKPIAATFVLLSFELTASVPLWKMLLVQRSGTKVTGTTTREAKLKRKTAAS